MDISTKVSIAGEDFSVFERKPRSEFLMKKFVTGKERVLIINPGANCRELLKEPNFFNSYISEELTPDRTSHLISFIQKGEFDIVLLDSSGEKTLTRSQLNHLNYLKINKVRIFDLVGFYERITRRIPLVHLSESWIINNDLFFVHKNSVFLFLKRLFDLFFTLAFLPLAFALVIPALILIKLTSPGPGVFVQNRVGRAGRVFKIYKLRTMTYNLQDNGHTLKNDNRVTAIGRILRRTKIDELPQLLNILKGDMSLVGPRPEKDNIVEEFSKDNPYYILRHMVRPGVTGWAQVNHPTATPLENLQKLEYDLFYIKNMSPIWDLKVIWKTVKVVLTLDSL